jgi:hypothetical protein
MPILRLHPFSFLNLFLMLLPARYWFMGMLGLYFGLIPPPGHDSVPKNGPQPVGWDLSSLCLIGRVAVMLHIVRRSTQELIHTRLAEQKHTQSWKKRRA